MTSQDRHVTDVKRYPKTADVDVWSKDVPRRQLTSWDETVI